MKLTESQGKQIFKEYNIPLPKQFQIEDVNQEVIVKAQVLVGGRGKAGGILKANKDNIQEITNKVLSLNIKGEQVKEVLIEEAKQLQRESRELIEEAKKLLFIWYFF